MWFPLRVFERLAWFQLTLHFCRYTETNFLPAGQTTLDVTILADGGLVEIFGDKYVALTSLVRMNDNTNDAASAKNKFADSSGLQCTVTSYQLSLAATQKVADPSKTLLDLESISDKINSNENAGWKAKPNSRFHGTTFESAQKLCGVHEKTQSLPTRPPLPKFDGELPTQFDARTDFGDECKEKISKVHDQSECGNCWAFGSVTAFSDRRCIAHGDQTVYSVASMTACCSGEACAMSQGCGGGIPTMAWFHLASDGVPSGGDYDSAVGE